MNGSWRWEYQRYDPKSERPVESLCALGNGRFATRGSAPETTTDDIHYPATYLAGCYDRLTSTVAGRTVSNEDMVRLPDWTALRYRCLPDDAPPGDWLTPDHPALRHYRVSLDLRTGTLTRRLLFLDAEGRRLGVTHTRLVHMGDPYLAAQRTVLRAYGWSGRLEVASVLDGDVVNAGVDRYRALAGRHLVAHRTGVNAEGVSWLSCATSASRIRIGIAVRTCVRPVAVVDVTCTAATAQQSYVLPIGRGQPVVVVKTAALCTSLDRPRADPVRSSVEHVAHAADAWEYCREALLGDITDVQGGTTGEGIHLGAMAGTLDLVERGVVGLEAGADGLHVDPVPLSEIPASAFTVCYLGHRDIRSRFRPGRLGVRVPTSLHGPVPLVLPGGRREHVAAGQERWFRLSAEQAAASPR